jgi:hypothetical protein
MRIYIYTIPKAGTYLLADFVARLGFANTGHHVSRDRFLNTAKLDLDTNARTPSKAMERQFFVKTLREQVDSSVSFGHLPVPLMGFVFPDFRFVCAYRHPRKTLMSEFVDFRFRREDIKWIARDAIPDDRAAFVAFLQRHGQAHMSIFANMIAVTLLRSEPLCARYDARHIHLTSFDAFLADPAEAIRIAAMLDVGPDQALTARAAALLAETKTKATGLDVDRDALWSDEAEELYAALNPEAFVTRGRELGWVI